MALLLGGALALTGCSSLRVAYGNAQTLLWWWLDGYVNFDRDQKPAAKAALSQWLAWHRHTQLPQYRQWLQQTETLMRGSPSGEQLCARLTAGETFRDQALTSLVGPVTEIAVRLRPAQIAHLEQRFTEKNAEWADKYFQRDLQRRRDAAADRAIEQAERFYGRLDRAQKRWLSQRVQGSPWRPELDLSERQARQRDAVATLRLLGEPGLPPERARALTTAWLERLARPVDRPHGEARDASRRYLCDLAADFHREQATAGQKEHLAAQLAGWEHDIDGFLPD